ncbi:helix-turn-helix domain-containing protein [Microvirga lotononidis]|uniref:DNA-binding domain-containing protein, AraC-type n=1 Tax=Microvirga lotononidis TaxID=864069 RepID=I4Z3J1_9HYPH|nr:AraC family transcriptional regulator [Microvirga lotononidis]EIM30783.1 DNA-binding domain-containing protein, AraC-type [Microvirga lotononidis]WQO31734.1 AraC family transcriptional regulator [Microvirga lotononidis]
MTVHLHVSMPEPTADPRPGAQPLLLAMLEERAERTTGALDPEVADGIRRLLCPWLTDHRRSREHMAELLAMSGRTVDRRPRRRGTSYRTLANEIRFEVACCLLKGTEMSLGQIAAALGYSEASALSRAFRGWSGQAPGLWRAAHAANVLSILPARAHCCAKPTDSGPSTGERRG